MKQKITTKTWEFIRIAIILIIIQFVYNVSFPQNINLGFKSEDGSTGIAGITSPGINLQQGNISIADSETYDFGEVDLLSKSESIEIAMANTSDNELYLTGSPKIILNGTNATAFTINELSTLASLGVGASTSFTVEFEPVSTNVHSGQISIVIGGKNEKSYVINLQAIGVKLNQPKDFELINYKYKSLGKQNLDKNAVSTSCG